MSDITNEWRELRSKLGDLICHIDGMNESIESKMKKLQEKEEQQAELQAQIVTMVIHITKPENITTLYRFLRR